MNKYDKALVKFYYKKKNKLIAAVLLIFMGWLGAHQVYLGNMRAAILQALLLLIGIVTSKFLLVCLLLWLVYDFVTLEDKVNAYNTRLLRQIKEEFNI